MRLIEVMAIQSICLMVVPGFDFYTDGLNYYLSLGIELYRAREYIDDDFDMFFDSFYKPKDFSYYNMIR